MEIKTVAYPKINLHLAVGGKRADGYHEIASVFQLVEDEKYKDVIVINIEESSSLEIRVSGLEGTADSMDNTVYKAALLFFQKINLNSRVCISVEKHIPSQAGLGGGSSDAGAVLSALDSVYKTGKENLMELALQIGSDVPFFVSDCKAAVVTGRGEFVHPLKERKMKVTLFPNEEEKMSTSEAYRMLDSRKEVKPLQSVEELALMYSGPYENWDFYNDFELVNSKSPDRRMKLTGSGTCRYVIDLLQS